MTDNVMLADALQAMFVEVLASWDAPKVADVAALPLSHPDEVTRRVMWGRIRSFGFGIAERAAAGETEEQLQARVDRAIRKIVEQDARPLCHTVIEWCSDKSARMVRTTTLHRSA